jgi:hypothetical protein
MLADADALIATNASLWEELNHRLGLDSFGIVAPEASQRTAFHEDRCANSGSIMY